MCSFGGLLIAQQAVAFMLTRFVANAFDPGHGFVQFMTKNAYVLVFSVVLAEQSGLPIPAVPFLLVAGALSRTGQLSFGLSLTLAILACLLGDLSWYAIGLRHGSKVLGFVCRISLEPDSCVRRTEELFSRQRERSLLLAKFVPGMSTVAPALAGVLRMRPSRFLFLDLFGAIFWAGSYMSVGYLFAQEIDYIVDKALTLGNWLMVVLAGGLAVYIIWKYLQRRQFLRHLRIARITPEDLKQKLDAGENPIIVDMRHAIEFDAEPDMIPSAIHLDPEELSERHAEIPRDKDIVLYCSCPNEATSARVALLLRQRGIRRVRPLAGGLRAWRARGFPVSHGENRHEFGLLVPAP